MPRVKTLPLPLSGRITAFKIVEGSGFSFCTNSSRLMHRSTSAPWSTSFDRSERAPHFCHSGRSEESRLQGRHQQGLSHFKIVHVEQDHGRDQAQGRQQVATAIETLRQAQGSRQRVKGQRSYDNRRRRPSKEAESRTCQAERQPDASCDRGITKVEVVIRQAQADRWRWKCTPPRPWSRVWPTRVGRNGNQGIDAH